MYRISGDMLCLSNSPKGKLTPSLPYMQLKFNPILNAMN
jgi:hypothetical protein